MMMKLIATPQLRSIREREHGLTQEEVKSLLALEGWTMSRQYYTQIENGQRSVGRDLALTIARIFKTPVDHLFAKVESVHHA